MPSNPFSTFRHSFIFHMVTHQSANEVQCLTSVIKGTGIVRQATNR